jgi:tRNA-2-methylthio-N6-dimethylallyladenosine synthase
MFNSWGLEKIGVANRKMELHSALKRESLPSNQSQYLTPSGTPPFVELIRAISQFDEIKTLRFMSSNPWDFHDQLIEEIANNHKLDRFIHLPVQSGSDSVLYRMNRGFTREDYLNLSKNYVKPSRCCFRHRYFVGFPGETEEEFCRYC